MLEIKPVTGTEPIKRVRAIKKEDAHPSKRKTPQKEDELEENEPKSSPPHIDELV